MPRCFSFPVLDKKEICKHLADLGAPKLSLDNLISPSPDALIPVYDFLSSCLSGSESRQDSLQPDFEALGDYPELHVESFAVLQSLTRLTKFMAAAGAEDFSVFNDLYRPESQRTIRFLSAAINYIMHSNSKMPAILKLCAERDEAIAKLEEMNEEKCKIENEIAQIEQERVAEHPQVEALEMEIKELNNKIQALNKQQCGMQLEINTLKQEDASLLDELSKLDFELMQKQQEGVRIRSQIVENPQELQKLLQEKKFALMEEEALGRTAAETCETWKAKVEVIAKAEKKIFKLQRMLQTLEEQTNDRNAADKILKERKARLKALEKEEWSLNAKNEELKWGVQRLEEHVEKYSKQRNEASKELQALKAQQEQQRIDHNSRLHAISEQDKQMEALLRMDAETLAQKESKILQLRAVTNKLLEMVGKMHMPAV